MSLGNSLCSGIDVLELFLTELMSHRAGSLQTAPCCILTAPSHGWNQLVVLMLCPLLRNRKSNLKIVNQTSHNFLWGWRIK